ncbi:MAG: CDP-alcohol phosphatidyltransferase family protein [Candidatus Eisenbacteria bacterium]|uniref:CDP-alcohol phosphatidyltransferase family protein n=1 Tax=Eiseniibacteriota bacterium TaxID=2212470 RepID=A0A938BSF5_UNCEI|nr:CDP-alcohol phosphatidyltransferase family protein [Candidatus Eisenbacteria bacterium]
MWRTKPTDRFVLRWIKLRLSAPLTLRLAPISRLSPLHLTAAAAFLGCLAGLLFALGRAWQAGCVAALAQILDGADGQLARLRNTASAAGAFRDSLLDRYADGAMLGGLAIFVIREPLFGPSWLWAPAGLLALVGSSQISYASARAQALGLDLGPPTLASKGTRMSVMILAAWASLLWRGAPAIALLYLALHTTAETARRLAIVSRGDRRAAARPGEGPSAEGELPAGAPREGSA